ncbi:unnamed protein product, partial [Rotaria magnacalcarata]
IVLITRFATKDPYLKSIVATSNIIIIGNSFYYSLIDIDIFCVTSVLKVKDKIRTSQELGTVRIYKIAKTMSEISDFEYFAGI